MPQVQNKLSKEDILKKYDWSLTREQNERAALSTIGFNEDEIKLIVDSSSFRANFDFILNNLNKLSGLVENGFSYLQIAQIAQIDDKHIQALFKQYKSLLDNQYNTIQIIALLTKPAGVKVVKNLNLFHSILMGFGFLQPDILEIINSHSNGYKYLKVLVGKYSMLSGLKFDKAKIIQLIKHCKTSEDIEEIADNNHLFAKFKFLPDDIISLTSSLDIKEHLKVIFKIMPMFADKQVIINSLKTNELKAKLHAIISPLLKFKNSLNSENGEEKIEFDEISFLLNKDQVDILENPASAGIESLMPPSDMDVDDYDVVSTFSSNPTSNSDAIGTSNTQTIAPTVSVASISEIKNSEKNRRTRKRKNDSSSNQSGKKSRKKPPIESTTSASIPTEVPASTVPTSTMQFDMTSTVPVSTQAKERSSTQENMFASQSSADTSINLAGNLPTNMNDNLPPLSLNSDLISLDGEIALRMPENIPAYSFEELANLWQNNAFDSDFMRLNFPSTDQEQVLENFEQNHENVGPSNREEQISIGNEAVNSVEPGKLNITYYDVTDFLNQYYDLKDKIYMIPLKQVGTKEEIHTFYRGQVKQVERSQSTHYKRVKIMYGPQFLITGEEFKKYKSRKFNYILSTDEAPITLNDIKQKESMFAEFCAEANKLSNKSSINKAKFASIPESAEASLPSGIVEEKRYDITEFISLPPNIQTLHRVPQLSMVFFTSVKAAKACAMAMRCQRPKNQFSYHRTQLFEGHLGQSLVYAVILPEEYTLDNPRKHSYMKKSLGTSPFPENQISNLRKALDDKTDTPFHNSLIECINNILIACDKFSPESIIMQTSNTSVTSDSNLHRARRRKKSPIESTTSTNITTETPTSTIPTSTLAGSQPNLLEISSENNSTPLSTLNTMQFVPTDMPTEEDFVNLWQNNTFDSDFMRLNFPSNNQEQILENFEQNHENVGPSNEQEQISIGNEAVNPVEPGKLNIWYYDVTNFFNQYYDLKADVKIYLIPLEQVGTKKEIDIFCDSQSKRADRIDHSHFKRIKLMYGPSFLVTGEKFKNYNNKKNNYILSTNEVPITLNDLKQKENIFAKFCNEANKLSDETIINKAKFSFIPEPTEASLPSGIVEGKRYDITEFISLPPNIQTLHRVPKLSIVFFSSAKEARACKAAVRESGRKRQLFKGHLGQSLVYAVILPEDYTVDNPKKYRNLGKDFGTSPFPENQTSNLKKALDVKSTDNSLIKCIYKILLAYDKINNENPTIQTTSTSVTSSDTPIESSTSTSITTEVPSSTVPTSTLADSQPNLLEISSENDSTSLSTLNNMQFDMAPTDMITDEDFMRLWQDNAFDSNFMRLNFQSSNQEQLLESIEQNHENVRPSNEEEQISIGNEAENNSVVPGKLNVWYHDVTNFFNQYYDLKADVKINMISLKYVGTNKEINKFCGGQTKRAEDHDHTYHRRTKIMSGPYFLVTGEKFKKYNSSKYNYILSTDEVPITLNDINQKESLFATFCNEANKLSDETIINKAKFSSIPDATEASLPRGIFEGKRYDITKFISLPPEIQTLHHVPKLSIVFFTSDKAAIRCTNSIKADTIRYKDKSGWSIAQFFQGRLGQSLVYAVILPEEYTLDKARKHHYLKKSLGSSPFPENQISNLKKALDDTTDKPLQNSLIKCINSVLITYDKISKENSITQTTSTSVTSSDTPIISTQPSSFFYHSMDAESTVVTSEDPILETIPTSISADSQPNLEGISTANNPTTLPTSPINVESDISFFNYPMSPTPFSPKSASELLQLLQLDDTTNQDPLARKTL